MRLLLHRVASLCVASMLLSCAVARADTPASGFEAHMKALERVLGSGLQAGARIEAGDLAAANEALAMMRGEARAAGWPLRPLLRSRVSGPLDDRQRWRWYRALEAGQIWSLVQAHWRQGDLAGLAPLLERVDVLVGRGQLDRAAAALRDGLDDGAWSDERRQELATEAEAMRAFDAVLQGGTAGPLGWYVWSDRHRFVPDRPLLRPIVELWHDSGAWVDRERAGALLIAWLREAGDLRGARLGRAWVQSGTPLPEDRASQLYSEMMHGNPADAERAGETLETEYEGTWTWGSAMYWRGLQLLWRGQTDAALAKLGRLAHAAESQSVLFGNSYRAEAIRMIGSIRFDLGDCDAARTALDFMPEPGWSGCATELQAMNFRQLYVEGRCLEHDGRLIEAVGFYWEAAFAERFSYQIDVSSAVARLVRLYEQADQLDDFEQMLAVEDERARLRTEEMRRRLEVRDPRIRPQPPWRGSAAVVKARRLLELHRLAREGAWGAVVDAVVDRSPADWARDPRGLRGEAVALLVEHPDVAVAALEARLNAETRSMVWPVLGRIGTSTAVKILRRDGDAYLATMDGQYPSHAPTLAMALRQAGPRGLAVLSELRMAHGSVYWDQILDSHEAWRLFRPGPSTKALPSGIRLPSEPPTLRPQAPTTDHDPGP